MIKRFAMFAVTLAFAATFAACESSVGSDAGTIFEPSYAETGPADPTHKYGDRSNVLQDWAFVVYIPCANGGLGERADVEGVLHHTFNTVENPAGGWHFTLHTNTQGVSGYGRETGEKYVVRLDERWSGHSVRGAGVFNVVMNGKIQGRTNQYTFAMISRYIIDANGQPRVEVDETRVDCR